VIATIFLSSATAFAQKPRTDPVCSQVAAAAFKPLPALTYECPEGPNDYDEAILKLPQEGPLSALIAARRFSVPWWRANVV
jgi:hypothetical protein